MPQRIALMLLCIGAGTWFGFDRAYSLARERARLDHGPGGAWELLALGIGVGTAVGFVLVLAYERRWWLELLLLAVLFCAFLYVFAPEYLEAR
jgi:hypothetical protein